ncbi:hypothetical protein KQX54_004992 [Cotesia glomerata]|nr:hypothetical protein KQX54_004992 [Cotesia glomerata]
MKCQLTWLGAILVVSNFATIVADGLENKDSLMTVSNGMNQFATEFYQKSSENNPNNLICSPISAGVVLAMATYGARGNTEKQMRASLRMPEDNAVGKNGFQSLLDSLHGINSVELKLAQKIFTAIGFEVKQEFKDITEKNFYSAAESLDFDNKAEDASRTINNWCAQQTNDHIKNLLGEDDVQGASIVLVNAVYFKGGWEEEFEKYLTEPIPFHIDEKTTKNADMMFIRKNYNYGTLPDLEAIFVELPYKKTSENDATSMFIILPNQITGLKKAEESFNKVNFKELHDNQHSTPLQLSLPKFKVESTLQLQPILEKIGMTDMFQNSADFGGITEAPPLTISKVVQKAFIEVNEEGSEAAAATGMVGMSRSGNFDGPRYISVIIDRPFIFAIVHPATNTILFQGHITDPTL